MNNNTHHHAALYHCSLAIAAVAMAFTLNSCQDYEYGFTEEEIHATAVQREYVKEFQKEFPVIDPQHTWMCEPDVFSPNNMSTRATANLGQPTFTGEYQSVSMTDTWLALDYMLEGEDHRDGTKATVNFEYYAVEETTYYIYPMFWGEKFCKYNDIGFYYIDDNGFHTIDKNSNVKGFWTDRPYQNQTVGDKQANIIIVYEDGSKEPMPETAHPIGKETGGYQANPKNYADMTKTCPTCGGSGKTGDSWNRKTCTACGGKGKFAVDHIEMPKFSITVPAGIKWGLCLTTLKQQNGNIYNTDDLTTWYSNREYNEGKVTAAASFSVGGISYVSFEDAPDPCNCNVRNGNHSCGYGHYDHDFNDIVLCVTPRPIETTYENKNVRIMCEDLGGSFDWDFNDIVYDLKFEQGKNDVEKASITITLQAVGGTLPIHMIVQNEDLGELHELFGNQQKNDDGLYTPINVGGDGQTIKTPKELKTIMLEHPKMPDDYDFREIVREITLTVGKENFSTRADNQSTSSSETTEVSHTINFPDAEGDKAPQCFMTSTGTEWSSELVNIIDTYPLFSGWVANQKNNNWWQTDPNF